MKRNGSVLIQCTLLTSILPVLFLVLAVSSAYAFEKWEKTFGGSDNDKGYSVQQTTDGGYIIAGSTGRSWSSGESYNDVYLIKTDAQGNSLWQKTFGGNREDWGNSVQQTKDGGYIITGSTSLFRASGESVYLAKTDADGNSLWVKDLGGGAVNDRGNSVQQTTDGGYIITGSTSTFDVFLTKTDTNGKKIWKQTFGGPRDDWGNSVQQTKDGGYIIVGATYSYGAGNSDVYLIKTDAKGTSLWQKTFGGRGADKGKSVRQTKDGGYIIVGATSSFGAGRDDVYLIKTDAKGNRLWERTFGGIYDDWGSSVQLTTIDGGYIITGSTSSYREGKEDLYLIKTNAQGRKLWETTFEGKSTASGNSIQLTADGGYIIAGSTFSFTDGYYDVYLIKTDFDGNSRQRD